MVTYTTKAMKNPVFKLEAHTRETRRSRMAVTLPTNGEICPAARGLNRLVGCLRSASRSDKSLTR